MHCIKPPLIINMLLAQRSKHLFCIFLYTNQLEYISNTSCEAATPRCLIFCSQVTLVISAGQKCLYCTECTEIKKKKKVKP